MITVGTCSSKLRLVKTIKSDGSKDSEANIKTAKLTQYDPQTPHDFITVLKSLSPQQAIISGVTKYDELNSSQRRTLDNFSFDAPWLPFDRDYTTTHDNDKPDTPYIDLLSDVDPQLKHISYVLKSSASNIIKDNIKLNPHRSKLWAQFKPGSTTEQIKAYAEALFIKSFNLGYQHVFMSDSPRAYPTPYFRTIFDQACFSPERWSYEGVPVCEAPYTHNTWYEEHVGEQQYIDPELLQLTQLERMVYATTVKKIKDELKPDIEDKLKQLKRDYPEQDWDSISKGQLTTTTTLYSTKDGAEYKILASDVIDAFVNDDTQALAHYTAMNFRDPMDPDYGADKAELYFNPDKSLILHSFAHGPHYFRLMPSVTLIEEALIARGFSTTYTKKTPSTNREMAQTFKALAELAPCFYAEFDYEIDKTIDDLTKVASKPTLRKLLAQTVLTPRTAQKDQRLTEHPLNEYCWLGQGSGRAITFDTDMGIRFMTAKGCELQLASNELGLSGPEYFDEWLSDPKRKDVNGYGLYPIGTKLKLNMWHGFKVMPVTATISYTDIEPFVDYIKLITNNDPQGFDYVMDWMADLVQDPIRSEDIRTALILESEEKGTGKSTLIALLSSFFYPTNTKAVSKLGDVVGQFNSKLVPLVLLGVEEVANNTTYDVGAIKNIFKDMISNPWMEAEAKNIDAVAAPNRLHLIITSNQPFFYMDSNDRRYTTFKVPATRRGDKEYFGNLHSWWEEGGRDLVFTFLLKRKYETSTITESYRGKDTIQSAIDGLFGHKAWLFDFLSKTNKDKRYTSAELYGSYESYILSEGKPAKMSAIGLSKYLKTTYKDYGVTYKNNTYNIQIERLRTGFAIIELRSPEMSWADFTDVPVEEQTNYTEDKEVTL